MLPTTIIGHLSTHLHTHLDPLNVEPHDLMGHPVVHWEVKALEHQNIRLRSCDNHMTVTRAQVM